MNLKSLQARLSLVLRNTKADLFSSAAVDRLKQLHDSWDKSVDQTEASYLKIRAEIDKLSMHLPTESEMKADVTMSTSYIQKTVRSGFKATLAVKVRSTKAMTDSTIERVKDRFLNTPEFDNSVDKFIDDKATILMQETAEAMDRKLRGKKPKKREKSKTKEVHKSKPTKLVDPAITRKIRLAKKFERQGPASRASLREQLNTIIEGHVKNNMGNSGQASSKAYLRHQGKNTDAGPFSSTVQVEKVAPRTIMYSYQEYPYSVFDPKVSKYRGLSSEGRNPRRIISAALDDALTALRVQQPYIYRQVHS